MAEKSPRKVCGAQLRKKERGRTCRNPAGFKTPHLGEGRCWIHGGLTPVKHGRYSKLSNTRLRTLLDELQRQDQNVMDLEPEAQLMRALVIDYLNRYDDFIEKLDAWYEWQNSERARDGAPPVPRRFPELSDIKDVVEGTSRVVERIHKIQREGSITLDTFRTALEQIGMIISKHVADEDLLRAIEADMMSLVVDPKSFTREEMDAMKESAE